MASDPVDGVREMVERFSSEGLGLPPIPSVLRETFRSREHWCFASRDIQPGFMYGFQQYPTEVVAEVVANYVAVSHAGHGINSYAISYHLVYGRLALFAQTSWGGAYGDGAIDAARVADQFERCAELIETYEAYAAADLLPPPPARLIVVESSMREAGICRWLPHPTGASGAAEWLEASSDMTELPTCAAHDLLTRPIRSLSRTDD